MNSSKIDQLQQLLVEKQRRSITKKEYGPVNEFALLKQGDVVLDLGSGDGTDCFEALEIVGTTGRVMGIETDQTLVELANQSVVQSGASNIGFIMAEFENLPINDNSVDVVVSNRAVHRVENKAKVFSEIHRVLRKGGHFNITDVVFIGTLDDKRKKHLVDHYDLTEGLIEISDYLNGILESRFTSLRISKGKRILLSDELTDHSSLKSEFISGPGLFTVTFFAEKNR